MNYEDESIPVRRYFLYGTAAVIGLTGLVTVLGSWYTVDQGERAVLLRWGQAIAVEDPGLHFKAPWIESVTYLPVRVQQITWAKDKDSDSRMQSYSKDQQPASISVNVSWRVLNDDNSITQVYSQFKNDDGISNSVLQPRTLEAVKNIFGRYNAVTVIQDRQRFNVDVANEVARLLKGYPIHIEGVQIQDISFSDAYEQAVEQRMTAQVQVQNLQQQQLQKEIQAKITVINARANADAKKLAGDAEAYAIQRRADALKANEGLVALTAVEKWDGKLPTTMVPGSAVPFLKVNP